MSFSENMHISANVKSFDQVVTKQSAGLSKEKNKTELSQRNENKLFKIFSLQVVYFSKYYKNLYCATKCISLAVVSIKCHDLFRSQNSFVVKGSN